MKVGHLNMSIIPMSQLAETGSHGFFVPESRPVALIAEDDPGVLLVMARMAKRAGLEVITATDGAEALIRFKQSPTPLILTDINMPRLDGLQLLRQIKDSFPETFVILVSAYPDQVGLRDEADYVLRKPFLMQEFDAAIQAFFNRRGQHQR